MSEAESLVNVALNDRRGFLAAMEAGFDGNSADWCRLLGAHFRYPSLSMDVLRECVPDFSVIGLREATARLAAVLTDSAGRRLGVLADPTAVATQAWIEGKLQAGLEWHLAFPDDLRAFLARHEQDVVALDASLTKASGVERGSGIEEISLQTLGENVNPVIRLVNSTVYDALKAGASDIHLEAGADGLVVKYRVDGVLGVAGEIAGTETAAQVVSRVKILAELDIAEQRVPQDGRFKARVRGRDVDFRVSIMPGVFGEDAVIRILDKEALAGQVSQLRLDALGFDAPALASIRRLAAEPYGMLLVTGPTGSGKTTTLYAALTEINDGREKIITIEDPVEYQLPGVLQIPVNERKGLTFARGLRSILRHDPDKILVGEIRDAETAEIAVQSALTGHLVFTTVHANNVFDVIGRFIHMEVDPFSFVSALNGIVAQRLVRQICEACAVEAAPSAELLFESGLGTEDCSGWRFRTGRGCGLCRGTGYRGRRAIAEFMMLNDELRELIMARTSIRELKVAAVRSGTRSLRQAALEVVRNGVTTLDEINRVTFVGER